MKKAVFRKKVSAVLAAACMVFALALAGCDSPTSSSGGRVSGQPGQPNEPPPPSFGISLDITGAHTFAPLQVGYEQVTPRTVLVSNSGNQSTGPLAVHFINGGDFFTLSTGSLPGIPAGGYTTFTVAPVIDLLPDTYTATVMVSGGENIVARVFGVSFTVTEGAPPATFGISLSPVNGMDFGSVQAGGAAPLPRTVTIHNTGNQPTGELTVQLSGLYADSFELSHSFIPSIAVSGENTETFTVAPVGGLAPGIHTATVTVSGGEFITPVSFYVTVTVFVPVTDITGVPNEATAGTPLTLTGTVLPSDATSNTIVWSVANAGGTGAVITGNTLNTTAAGTVTVTATIAEGLGEGIPFTQNFTITVTKAFAPVTDIIDVPGTAAIGTPLTLTGTVMPPNATHSTIVWSVASAGGTGAVITDNTLNTMAAGTVTVTATIAEGLGEGIPFTQNFTITVTLPPLTGTVTITGDPVVGEMLTANIAALSGTGIPTFQWERGTAPDFTAIPGAHAPTYTVRAADAGQMIRVVVTRPGYASAASAPTAAVPVTGTAGLVFTWVVGVGYSVTGFTGTAREVVIPDVNNGMPVTAIGNHHVFYRRQLTSVSIPGSITTIGNNAFQSNQLTDIAILGNVTSIGTNAFSGNPLTSVTLGMANIGNSWFDGSFTSGGSGGQLTSVTFLDGVTTIGWSAFRNNRLTDVIIPDSVTSIGGWAFRDNQLTSVTIPDSVTTIGSYAFSDNQLTSVVIPDSVTVIGSGAFSNNQLTSVSIPFASLDEADGAWGSPWRTNIPLNVLVFRGAQ